MKSRPLLASARPSAVTFPKRASFLLHLARLAAAITPSRAGTTAPGAGAALAAAPSELAGASAHVPGRLRRSLRACTAEGMLAEVVSACAGGAVLTGWALYLGASPFLTGLVVALPQMAQLCQIPAAWTTALLGHRRACVWMVALSRQAMLPLAVLPFLPLTDEVRRQLLLAFAAVAAVLGVLGNNAWVAWMGELVPPRVRGRYFGKRTALCMLGGAVASGVAGLVLDAARARGFGGHALAGLQITASVAGVLTTLLLRRQHDPAAAAPRTPPSFIQAVAPFRSPAARTVMLYQVLWNLAVGMAGSFFALFMLRDLRMGFALVSLHGAAFAGMKMLAAPYWGRLIDRVGARPVLVACSFGIGFVPFLWLLPTPTALWPLVVDVLVAGVLWSGHQLAAFALPLACSPRQGRPFYVGAFATVSGLAFSVATAAGGALATWLPDVVEVGGRSFADLQVLFALSGVLRLTAAWIGIGIVEPAGRPVSALWTAPAAARPAAPAPAREP